MPPSRGRSEERLQGDSAFIEAITLICRNTVDSSHRRDLVDQAIRCYVRSGMIDRDRTVAALKEIDSRISAIRSQLRARGYL